nr:hypothetical protein [Myxococcaceae bacterium]
MLRALVLVLALPLVAVAGPRTVDGDPSDWNGTPPTGVHQAATSGDEWILRGVAGDRRTDPGMTSDADLVELRLTTDGTALFGLVRLADITAANAVHLALGFDTTAGGQNFLGDQNPLTVRTSLRPERQLAIHVAGSGNAEIEWFDSGTWYAIVGSAASISVTNDVVEFRVPLADLNGLTATSTFTLTAVTFNNAQGWNNDIDTTATQAVDALGVPGQAAPPANGNNAWERELSNGTIDVGWRVTLTGATAGPTAVPAGECQENTTSSTGEAPCTACAANTATIGRGETQCVPCVAGEGSDAGQSCALCAPGGFGLGGGLGCASCNPGTQAPDAGLTSCEACAPGRFAGQSGAVTCSECSTGSFSAVSGATSCTACAAGRFAATTGSTACTECSVGTFAASTGASSCVPCPLGRFADTTGSTSCQDCAAGTFA